MILNIFEWIQSVSKFIIKLYNKKIIYCSKIINKNYKWINLMFIFFIDNEINIIKFFILNFDVYKLVIIYNNVYD